MNKLRIKENSREQFQIGLRTPEGTITCVVSVPAGPLKPLIVRRRNEALRLAKALAQRLDAEIEDASAPKARVLAGDPQPESRL